MDGLQHRANFLLHNAVTDNTRQTYNTSLNAFERFRCKYKLPGFWPIPEQHLIWFLAYCHESNCASSTVRTYISGINFHHKIRGFSNILDNFAVNKMLEGYARVKPQVKDARRPITKLILTAIADVLHLVCYNLYESKLFRAIFTLAYFGLFRISELVAPGKACLCNQARVQDIQVSPDASFVSVTLVKSKTSQSGPPITLKIPREKQGICPVRALQDYLAVAPTRAAAFSHKNGKPVTRTQVTAVLQKCLSRTGYNAPFFQSHSFRIGRATDLSARGYQPLP